MERQEMDIHLKDVLISHLTSPHFIRDEAERRRFFEGCGLSLDTDRFALVVVQIERWSSVLATAAEQHEASKHHFFLLHNMLHELLGQEDLSVEAEKDYQMVCLVALHRSWQEFCSSSYQRLQEMMEILEAEFDVSVTVSVSREVRGLNALPEAYVEAREALWYNMFLELDMQILFYEDLRGERYPTLRPDLMALDKKLMAELQARNPDGVKYVLHEMIDREFLQSRPPIRLLRTRLGGICCRIIDALEELKSTSGDGSDTRLKALTRIVDAGTISELTSSMDELLDAVSLSKDVGSQEPKPQWVDKMALYIGEHYTDESLGLTEVSAVFGITPSYATRVFKQYTGRGIYETIQHVRLAAAKDLMQSDMTMKQIAQMVGYTSFLSMNRAFKKFEGTTPSRFRDQ